MIRGVLGSRASIGGVLGSGRGGAAAGLPVANPVLWLDASQITGLGDGSAITTWNDASASGYNVTQAGASTLKPTYKTGIINGKPAVRFDGGDYLTNASATMPLKIFTAFVVFQESTARNYAGVLVFTPPTGNDYNSAAGMQVCGAGDASNHFEASGSVNYQMLVAGTGVNPPTVWTHKKAAGRGDVYKNGTAAANDTSFTEFNDTATGVLVGARYVSNAITTTYGLIGDIAEIILYNSALSDGDRQAVEAYLAAKYAIT